MGLVSYSDIGIVANALADEIALQGEQGVVVARYLRALGLYTDGIQGAVEADTAGNYGDRELR